MAAVIEQAKEATGLQQEHIVRLYNLDGSDESAGVVKVALPALAAKLGATKLAVKKVEWTVQGFYVVNLVFDHTTDVPICSCAGNGVLEFSPDREDNGVGGTGDIVLTTVGVVANATYTIILTVIPK